MKEKIFVGESTLIFFVNGKKVSYVDTICLLNIFQEPEVERKYIYRVRSIEM